MSIKPFENAYILAGGKSSRMGTDKGLIDYQGNELISYSISLLAPLFNQVSIITNNLAYTKFNLPILSDVFSNKGPLAGIYTGLVNSNCKWNFFLACDMPNVSTEIIYKLQPASKEYNAIMPFHHNFPEPLCAFYNVNSLPLLKNQLDENDFKMQNLVKKLNVKEIDFTNEFESTENPFVNLNTLDELNNSIKS